MNINKEWERERERDPYFNYIVILIAFVSYIVIRITLNTSQNFQHSCGRMPHPVL